MFSFSGDLYCYSMIDGDTAALVSKMKNRDPKWVSYGTVKFWVIRNILWFTGLYFVCTCCSGSHIFQTVAVLSVSLRLEFVHLLRSVVCTRGLPRSCRSRVVSGCTSSFWSAVHFNEGGSEASVCQVPSRIRGVITLKHWTRARALLTRCSSSSHSRDNLVWMDGWMGLNLQVVMWPRATHASWPNTWWFTVFAKPGEAGMRFWS